MTAYRVGVGTLFLASILTILFCNIFAGVGVFLLAAGVEVWFLSRREDTVAETVT